ncbi:MAG TPA: hypothetical protein VFH27_06880 [Longimicrobiaceae bacterium]|nr:hypothetical protein [Longimicrobiaceae bacterium]
MMTPHTRFARTSARPLALVLLALAGAAGTAAAQTPDPRVGLRAGWMDAAEVASNVALVGHADRAPGFANPQNMGDFGVANSDLAFSGRYAFQGGYHGFQVWDLANPARPTLRTSFVCPGGQGDLSVYRNLLFMSVEETRGRVDCGTGGVQDTVSAERFRGVRIFDISDLDHPRQVAAVQTCRGSHTHTLVPDPRDPRSLYVYVSGTSSVRPAGELAGCSRGAADDTATAYFRIEIIKVPLAQPALARIVNRPRVFADRATGNIAGLWQGGAHGEGTQTTSLTNQCHDITVYPKFGLAAGACSGNGILLDIRDPANPVRIDEVMDPNFAYWHSATFSNDADKVLFSDEWGGGVAARCQATDPVKWGADAIFTLRDRKLTPAGYFKLPAAQTATENCVAHNGSLIPVPGRTVMVQAWYQGGLSVFDFTDPAHATEIAFFDRGPMSAEKLALGGLWSAYWYNGHIYGSEIGRGFDVLDLKPSAQLSQNEIDAARLVMMDRFNPQVQEQFTWPARFVVARAYVDQLARGTALPATRTAAIARELDRAERLPAGPRRRAALRALAVSVRRDAAGSAESARLTALASTLQRMSLPNG